MAKKTRGVKADVKRAGRTATRALKKTRRTVHKVDRAMAWLFKNFSI